MTLDDAINGVELFMTEQAKAMKVAAEASGLVPHYSAKKHSGAAGKYIAKVVEEGLTLDAMAATLLFHSLANHSAWRQKFTKMGIFPEAVKAEVVGENGEKKAQPSKLEKLMASFQE